jgi:tetratricopeptide (TPR) repeat protein
MADFDKLWDYGNPAGTTIKFLEILEQIDVLGNESTVGQLYTQLGRMQGLQANWDDAYAYLDKAKALLDKADTVTEVRYLLELGRTHNSLGDKEKAYKLFNRAWGLAKTCHADGYVVDVAHMLAIASESHQTMLDWNMKAIEFATQSTQPEAQHWLGSLYNNTGWTYFDDGDHHTALNLFEKALIEREKQGKAENIRIAKWCVARVQRELGQVNIALETQLALLEAHQETDSEDQYVYEELAHCYSALSDIENASKYAKLAQGLLLKDEWMVKNEPDRLQALTDLM